VFLDAGGAVVSSADMDPCPATDATACPITSATAAYTDAVEVPRGDLDRLGMTPGSHTAFGTPCRPR
jgi:uncharacterized membrane protein (UPF0127 family)